MSVLDDRRSANTVEHAVANLDDRATRFSAASPRSGRFSEALLSINGLMNTRPVAGVRSKAGSDTGAVRHEPRAVRKRAYTEGWLDDEEGDDELDEGGMKRTRVDEEEGDDLVDYHPLLRVGIDAFGGLVDEPELRTVPADVLHSDSLNLNEPNPAKLLANVTPFMDFLAEACGFIGMQLSACFVQQPHPDCVTYESYRPYLHELPRASITQTIGLLEKTSKAILGKQLTLQEALRIGGHPMKNALAKYCSGVMRSAAKGNPHRANITKQDLFSSLAIQNDGFEALGDALIRLKKSNHHMRK